MNFLAPLFLLGAAAVAAPVIFHLIRRTTRERIPFSSVMFLQPSPPRLSRRHRLEHLLLLLLRCAVLLLLAFGFARPFFPTSPSEPPSAANATSRVLLVDISASMRREGLWQQARAAVDAQLRRAQPGDRVAVAVFDRQVTELVSFDDWQKTAPGQRAALVTGRVASVSPGWGSTHLGQALVRAAELVGEAATAKGSSGPREVVVISDLQEGSRLEGLQGFDWPKSVQLLLVPLDSRRPNNAGLQLIADAPDAVRTATAAARVRVVNAPRATKEQFQIGWVGDSGNVLLAPIDAYVPPGQSRVFTVPVPAGSGVPNRIALTGDEEPFDNTVHIVPPAQYRASVLWLGGARADDSRSAVAFLRRAFSGTPRVAVDFRSFAQLSEADAPALQKADLIFVDSSVAPEAIRAARAAVEQGRTVALLLARGGRSTALSELTGVARATADEVAPANYAMLGEIDFRHPLFASFADPRFSDFTKIHVWRYRRFDAAALPDAHVLAKFDSGDPAVVELSMSKGRVFIFGFGWQPDDSQLAVSSKFVPLMWSLLETAGFSTAAPQQVFVGDVVAAPKAATAVRDPGGKTVALVNNMVPAAATQQPGVYEFVGLEHAIRFVVNVDANESRTAPMLADELARLGVPLATPDAAESARALLQAAQAVETENRQKIWRWLIGAALMFVVFESALAGRTGRRAASVVEEPA